MNERHQNDYVIIMAGGVGTRFWPRSRKSLPKQFLDILGTGSTLIQDTFKRFSSFIPAENIYIVTNADYKDLVLSQIPNISEDQVLLEPIGRNTAPCIAYAVYKIREKDPNANYVVAPADHLIADTDTFTKNIELGLDAVQKENIIMTLGIQPTRPDTGYGYIQFVKDDQGTGYHQVKTFTEKPQLEFAIKFVESGDFLWNGGIFLFSTNTIVTAFQSYLEEMAELFEGIKDSYYTDNELDAIDKVYRQCKPISIDNGIMEFADKDNMVYTIPSDFGWSDLGTWGSVHDNSEKDDQGNSVTGKSLLYDCSNNIIQFHGDKKKLVVAKGLEGFIIVETEDAILICKKEEEQFIKNIVTDLKTDFDGVYV
ncbi:MAG: mannose-1-phosphate guanylyltransferase [Bacteroidia bacterium]